MDNDYFMECRDLVITKEKASGKIGVLAEKTIHSVIKHYLSQNIINHEIKIGTYYADVFTDGHIYEVQTRGFDKLRPKLAYFLESYPVTVVYPMANIKYLRWISPVSGEISPPRKSPRQGNPLNVFAELYKIRPFLTHPGFSLKIMMMDMEEYRMLDGWSKDKKKGCSKCDKLPTSLVAEYDFVMPEDYMMFLPPELPDEFTSEDLAKASHVSKSISNTALLLLTELGVVSRIGKKGRFYLYRLVF